MLLANVIASLLFSFFWFFDAPDMPLALIWQPAVIALLYIAGQSFILNAVAYGDVSVAAPVASSKVIIVPLLLTFVGGISLSTMTWIAAGMAMVGVVLINYIVPESGRRQVLFTAALAFAAGFAFASFDVAVQSFSPNWGIRIVPVSYWMVGLFSLALYPLVDSPKQLYKSLPWIAVTTGCFLVAAQACLLVYALATAHDAARINVVYSLRGLWGVVFAWLFADWFGGNESKLPINIMLARLGGALLLLAAVVITILETSGGKTPPESPPAQEMTEATRSVASE